MKSLMRYGMLLLCCVSSASFADSYFVAEPQTVAVSKDDGAAATELIQNALEQMPGQSVTKNEKSAQFVLKPKLIKLGNAYLLSVEKLKDGKVLFSTQLKAYKMEDLDTIAHRLVRSAVDQVPAKEDSRVGEITEGESKATNQRKETFNHWYLGFGPHWASFASDSLYNFNFGYAWDMNVASLGLFLDLTSGEKASYSEFDIAGRYFLSNQDISPFIMAQLGNGTATLKSSADLFSDNKSASGWMGGLGIGYQFFRTSSVNLEVLFQYNVLFARTTGTSDGVGSTPGVYGLRVGLYF